MDQTTTLLIIGGVAVAAWLGGYLTRFGFPPPSNFNLTPPAGQVTATPSGGAAGQGIGQGLQTGINQKASFLKSGGFTQNDVDSGVAYSYSGYTSAPITVS